MSIRKGNKVSAHTNSNVVILGTVIGVLGDRMTVKTEAGESHDVLREGATKVSATEFKAMLLEATQPTTTVKAPTKTAAKTAVKKALKSKKGEALKVFNRMHGKARKDIIAAFKAKVGLSSAGASTYYQNFKSGSWSTEVAK